VHNNWNDALGKFDPKSDVAIFLGYSSHNKACKVFSKRTLCVEKSVHVLYDKTNSLVENDAQDEEFELGLTIKDILLMHEKGECLEDRSGPGANLLEGGQGLVQTGGSVAEPNLKKNQPNFSRTGCRTCLETGSRIGLETGSRTGLAASSRTDPEPVSPSISARMKSIPVNPRP